MLVFEMLQMFGVCPFLRRIFADLHQADFLGATPGVGIETAFAPDDGFHQRRFDTVPPRRSANRPILAAFQAPFAPNPKTHGSGEHCPRQQCPISVAILQMPA